MTTASECGREAIPEDKPWTSEALDANGADVWLPFSLEEDFVSWREQFWPAVCEHFGVEALGDESR